MRRYYASLQAGRGLAALAVVLFHIWVLASAKLGHIFAGGWFSHGSCGVDFFFVLSGFVIMYINRQSIGVPGDGASYFYRRLVRIYPLLLILTLAKLAYMLVGASGVPDYKNNLSTILASTLLIPQAGACFIGPSWSLCFEMFFYAAFLLIILFGRGLRWWIAGYVAACFLLNLPFLPRLHYPVSFLFSPYMLEFCLGCFAAWLCANNLVPGTLAKVCVGSGLALAAVGLLFYNRLEGVLGQLLTPFLGTSFFLIITGAAALEQQGAFTVPRGFAFLGDASYSIYLAHTSILEVGINFMAAKKGWFGGYTEPALFGLAVITVILCCGLYLLVEKPLCRWLRDKGPRRARPAVQPQLSRSPFKLIPGIQILFAPGGFPKISTPGTALAPQPAAEPHAPAAEPQVPAAEPQVPPVEVSVSATELDPSEP